MGLPNKSDMFVSKKEFHATNCNFFQELDPVKSGVSREEKEVKSTAYSLKIKVSCPGGEVIKVEEDCKTPTALMDHNNKIRLKCPPAPRKPKSLPSSTKRSRVLLDLSNEIESLFPPALLKDLLSGKINKVRKESGIM
ncbi:cyclin-dependent protein kinase inhibitor SMR10-like [Forsythia ovata]|uniref:Cyclin-dependent protein kinase inhibitor SMR10-like n=1 Tax=Forsythia ovata TaxID=205694 RepID=A0ABD1RIM4_9LAMI